MEAVIQNIDAKYLFANAICNSFPKKHKGFFHDDDVYFYVIPQLNLEQYKDYQQKIVNHCLVDIPVAVYPVKN